MPASRPRVLVIDDKPEMLTCLENCLALLNYSVDTALGGRLGIEKLERESFDLILTDLKMPVVDGMEVIRRARAMCPELKIVVITAYATIESTVEAIRAGAVDYITKPFKLDEMGVVLERALQSGNDARRKRRKRPATLVGHSPAMQQLRSQIDLVADATTTVLIQGESGTGKELVARGIHARSPRRDRRFVSFSCAALNDNLLMNELFGHVPGSYTDARHHKRGLIEEADGGTLFLDEIAETSQQFQIALLRVLPELEILRVGDTKPTPVDFRLVAATNKNLYDEVCAGRFREDLYFRLNVIVIDMPTLRERREDVPLLAQHFLSTFCEEKGKTIEGIEPDAMQMLQAYHWPGNVRQLESAIERAVVMCTAAKIRRRDFPPEVLHGDAHPLAAERLVAAPFKMAKEEFTKHYLEQLLKMVNGNVTRAAEVADVARTYLHDLMRRHDVEATRFRT